MKKSSFEDKTPFDDTTELKVPFFPPPPGLTLEDPISLEAQEDSEQSSDDQDDQEWTTVVKNPKKTANHRRRVKALTNDQTTTNGVGEPDVVFHRRGGSPKKTRVHRSTTSTDVSRHLAKIDNDTDVSELKKVRPELSRRIIEYRRVNNLTQVELAQKLNFKEDIVRNYENGSAIHDGPTTSKFYKLLGTFNKQ